MAEIPHKTNVKKSLFKALHNAITPDESDLTEEGQKLFESKIFRSNMIKVDEDIEKEEEVLFRRIDFSSHINEIDTISTFSP